MAVLGVSVVGAAGAARYAMKKVWMAQHYAERGGDSAGWSGAGSARKDVAKVQTAASPGVGSSARVKFTDELLRVKDERDAAAGGEHSGANGDGSIDASDTGSAARSPGASAAMREASSPVCPSPKLGWKQAMRAEQARTAAAAAAVAAAAAKQKSPPPPSPTLKRPGAATADAPTPKRSAPSPRVPASSPRVTSPRVPASSPRVPASSPKAANPEEALTDDERLALELHRQMNCTPIRRSRSRVDG